MPSFALQISRAAASVLLAVASSICICRAEEPDYEALAQQEFAQSKYKEAAATLRLAIYKGSKSAAIWLLLGESYEKQDENGAARQTYQSVVKYFPTSRECQIALEHLSTMAAPLAQGKGGAAPAKSAAGLHLIDRIVVVPPLFGHPAVDPGTIALVRKLVGHLPRPIYKILDQGKTNIFITPNLIDKFPDAVKFRMLPLQSYLSAEYGRTYGRDIYICERHALTGGGTALSSVHDATGLTCTTYTQLSHAFDDCLEMPSKDEQFLQLYRQDAAAADVRKNPNMKPYVLEEANGPGEAFGGLAASLMGDDSQLADQLNHTFPRSRAWIERRIQLLSGDTGK